MVYYFIFLVKKHPHPIMQNNGNAFKIIEDLIPNPSCEETQKSSISKENSPKKKKKNKYRVFTDPNNPLSFSYTLHPTIFYYFHFSPKHISKLWGRPDCLAQDAMIRVYFAFLDNSEMPSSVRCVDLANQYLLPTCTRSHLVTHLQTGLRLSRRPVSLLRPLRRPALN